MASLPSQQYVSFDIFDTLLKRSVACPTDLFRYMERYCQYNGVPIPEGFAQKRIDAESSARRQTGGEVTIEDIYEELRSCCGENVSELRSIELSLELNGCRANPEMAELLSRCVKAGKVVVLISDMYLSSGFLSKMLGRCGIFGYEKLYVSCEYGCSKRSGRLFQKVLQDFQIQPDMLLHVGDNKKSDYAVPLSLGIHALKIDNFQKKLCCIPCTIKESDALAFRIISSCAANCVNGEGQFGQLGAETFGPLLTGFSIWLLDQIRRDGIKNLYFMSRDGYTLKRAFDALHIPNVKTHYLYCSRRAYTVPLLWKYPSFESVFQNISFYGTLTLSAFIEKLGLHPEDCIREAEDCGLNMNTEFRADQITQETQVRIFYEKIKEMVISASRDEYEALLSYILAQRLEKRIGVVDIGYHGTMQNALEQLLKEAELDIQVKGYYVAVSPSAKLINKNIISASGYLYEKGKNEQIRMNIPSSVFELVFLARHGSVKRFYEKEGHSEPDFYQYEYSVDSDDVKKLTEYQDGAVRFVHEYIHSFTAKAPLISPEVAIYNFKKMVVSPSDWEAEYWGDFQFFDVTYTTIAKPKSLSYYLTHLGELFSDFKHSSWKIGFLHRLFKIPFPYYYVVCFSQRIKHYIKKLKKMSFPNE